MASTIRKAISFGEDGVINPYSWNSQYLGYVFGNQTPPNYANLNLLSASQTKWVRLWIHPLTMWPTSGSLNTFLLDKLDYQIALAKAAGYGVILTMHHDLPPWVTGYNTNLQSTDDGYFSEPARYRLIPTDLSDTGPWWWLWGNFAWRYSLKNPSRPYNGYAYADVIEFCNEPNGNMKTWSTSSALTTDIPGSVALMFKRAKQYVASFGTVPGYGYSPIVGGPATSDIGPGKGPSRDYDTFTSSVLDRLAGNGFYDVGSPGMCVWTQHNYTDVTYDTGSNSVAVDDYPGQPAYTRKKLRSQTTVQTLAAKGWKGWPDGNPASPRLFITEGGAHRTVAAAFWKFDVTNQTYYENWQNYLMYRNLVNRLSNDSEGAGVELIANYLLITANVAQHNEFDTGLFRASDDANPLVPRSAYTNTWASFPGRL